MRVLLISLAIAISFLASAQSKDQNYVMSRHLLDDKGTAIATAAYYNGLEDTYYIYNNLGQLRYVLTPEYQKHPDLSAFAYQYEYDVHDNLVKRILPGAQYTQYWYDKDGRCVFSQDAGLRSKGLFYFYFYDRIGRLAVLGVCRHCKTNIGNIDVTVTASQSGDLLHSVYKCNEADIIDSDGAIVENINDYDSYDFLSGSHKAEFDSIAPKAEIQAVDSIDYLLGGNLVMKNGRIDKYLFGEGFCQAQIPSITWTKPHFFFSLDDKPTTKEQEEKNKEMLETWNALYNARNVADEFSFYYYNKDHLGNNREVINNYGSIRQVVNYYPFGTPYCDATSSLYAGQQPYKYNSKEFDTTHGLNTYDYGARQYNSILPSWDRLDPLCEKYYSISPYAYCHDNPVNTTDPDGMDDYYDVNGNFLGTNNNQTDYIYIANKFKPLGIWNGESHFGIYSRTSLSKAELSAKTWSKILTRIAVNAGVKAEDLHNGEISVGVLERLNDNINYDFSDSYNDIDKCIGEGLQFYSASVMGRKNKNGSALITAFIYPSDNNLREYYSTVSNIQHLLYSHEYLGHYIKGMQDGITLDKSLINNPLFRKTTQGYQKHIFDRIKLEEQ